MLLQFSVNADKNWWILREARNIFIKIIRSARTFDKVPYFEYPPLSSWLRVFKFLFRALSTVRFLKFIYAMALNSALKFLL